MAFQPDPGRRTYQETCDELRLTADELARYIADGKIVPSVFVNGRFTNYSIEEGRDGKPFWNELYEERVTGLVYLVQRVQTAPAKCEWRGFSAERGDEPFFAFETSYVSDDLPEACFFTVEEIERFRNMNVVVVKADPGLTLESRERMTVLKLLLAMARGGYGYDPKAKRNDAIANIVADVHLLGMPMTDDTVRRWLQEAVKHASDFQAPSRP